MRKGPGAQTIEAEVKRLKRALQAAKKHQDPCADDWGGGSEMPRVNAYHAVFQGREHPFASYPPI